jgi:tetratricopeptide (TPR) repeat protein/DNA-binding CsgD family transcriptional regulator
MLKNRWFFTAGFWLGSFLCIAQPDPKEIKALEEKFKTGKTDSAKVMTLNEMTWLFRKYDKKQALQYAEKALLIARKADFDEGVGFSQMAMGNVYNYHTLHDSAIVLYKKAVPFFEKIPAETHRNYRLGQLYYNMGEAYRAINYYGEAIGAFNQSAAFYKKNKNESELPNIYIGIANIYETQEQYEESLKYADKALQETQSLKDKETYCFVMNDLNNVYLSLHAKTKNPLYLTKAKANFYLTYRILQKNPEADPNGIITPTILSNLGECLLRESKYDSAAYFLNKSNSLAAVIQYKWVRGYNYMHLGEIAMNRRQLSEAEIYMAIAFSCRREYGDDFTLTLYPKLVKLQTVKGNFSEALRYQQLYQKDYEKILNAKKNRTVNEIQTRYQTREKEMQISDLQKENENKKLQLIGSVMLAVLGLIVAAAIFLVYQFRKRIFRQREQLLREEKEKAVLAKQLEAEAKENAVLQQQLTEQENQRIQEEIHLQNTIHTLQKEQLQLDIDFKQRELTTSVMQLEKQNGLLIQIKTQLQQIEKNNKNASLEVRELHKIIDESLDIETDFDKFMAHFENVHPQFFQQLQTLAGQSLSALDLKYAAYIRMQLSTKEIANLLGIEPKSVRMAQYRLKKKFSLSETDDLKAFLNQL